MNVMANPDADKVDFELASLAVSAINGCGMCIESHEKTLKKHEVPALAIQERGAHRRGAARGRSDTVEQAGAAAPALGRRGLM